jgi:hypothetical protein
VGLGVVVVPWLAARGLRWLAPDTPDLDAVSGMRVAQWPSVAAAPAMDGSIVVWLCPWVWWPPFGVVVHDSLAGSAAATVGIWYNVGSSASGMFRPFVLPLLLLVLLSPKDWSSLRRCPPLRDDSAAMGGSGVILASRPVVVSHRGARPLPGGAMAVGPTYYG